MSNRSVTPRARRLAWMVGAGLATVVLGWWPLTDRLDLPKQTLLGGVAIGLSGAAVATGHRRASPWLGLLVLLVLLGGAAMPGELGARVEGLAGWAAALLLGWVATEADGAVLGRTLAVVGAAVGLVALLQGAGLDWLGGTRAVSGTLGGPGHLGWTLALLLPFAGTMATAESSRNRAAALVAVVAAALVLSGSRTAWAMVLAGLPFWAVSQRGMGRLRWGLLVGGLLGLAVDVGTGRSGVPARVADLTSATGTAAGRIYLWRMYASDPAAWLGGGGGPESFVRGFPALQRRWLAQHPEHRGFQSDLRHAHADVVEVGFDFGIVGIGLLLWVALGAVRSGAHRAAPVAVIVSAMVGGLASPVLFFAPTLGIVAVAVGIRHRSPTGGRLSGAFVPLLVAMLWLEGRLIQRLGSEVIRSEATWARVSGAGSVHDAATRAVALDPRNARAWVERALDCEAHGDEVCACEAWSQAARDLPVDRVLAACPEGAPQ